MTGTPDAPMETEYDPDRVVIRDKRRLDPDSGQLRVPTAPAPAPQVTVQDEVEVVPDREAELLADLQRERAQFLNYKRRTESDGVAAVERVTGSVLELLLPLLDDVERARDHGDLTGGFKGVGEGLEAVVDRLGLERFGSAGEPFDPTQHEALMQAEPDPASAVAVCAQVLQQGYRLRSGRVLRPARVAVAEGTGRVNEGEAADHEAKRDADQRREAKAHAHALEREQDVPADALIVRPVAVEGIGEQLHRRRKRLGRRREGAAALGQQGPDADQQGEADDGRQYGQPDGAGVDGLAARAGPFRLNPILRTLRMSGSRAARMGLRLQRRMKNSRDHDRARLRPPPRRAA